MGNRHSNSKTKFSIKRKLNRNNTTPVGTTPGNTAAQTCVKDSPRYNQSKSAPANSHNYNHITVHTHAIDIPNAKVSNTKQQPSLWFNIRIKDEATANAHEKMLIDGIYRQVQFIGTMMHTQTKGKDSVDILQNMTEYSKHFTCHTFVYAKIYNPQQTALDQKNENIFLWHDGMKWIFSNYNTLHYFLDNINGKRKWVIKPEKNIENILISSQTYANDLNILKQRDRIIFKNILNQDFQIKIDNFYGKHYSKHQQQFEEDPTLRNVYRLWRENLNIFYDRNQLFTMSQLVTEEKQYLEKKEASDVRVSIDQINDICLSMEFRKLLKKYKDKSVKFGGWKSKGEIMVSVNDATYSEFHKVYIDNQTDVQLANMNVRDVVLQFHKYYLQLFAELNELEELEQNKMSFTYR